MPSTTLPRHARTNRIAAVVALTAVALLLTACMIPEESTAFNLVNRDRAAVGSAPLSANQAAVTKAQNWATHLALNSGGVCNSSKLIHSNLTDGAPAGWRALAENIACASGTGPWSGSVPQLHAQFMGSSGHRANLTNPRYNYAGIGLSMISTGPNSWVVFETQVFVQL